jgi:hypothetical protein
VLPTVYDGKIHKMGIGKGRIVEYAVRINMGSSYGTYLPYGRPPDI